MSRYNRFGAAYTDALALYPGMVVTDADAGGVNGQTKIEAVMDRVAREVAAAVTPEVFRQMTQVNAELVVRYATTGQTTANLGLTPALAGTLHLWRYPALSPLAAGWWSGNGYYPEYWARDPQIGINEVASTDFALTASTGAVALSGAGVLSLGDRLFATYDVDTTSASFAMASLADVVLLGTAAEIGAQLYSQGTQEWKLVEDFKARYIAAIVALRAGEMVPDELRKLNYWEELERTSEQVTSVHIYRG